MAKLGSNNIVIYSSFEEIRVKIYMENLYSLLIESLFSERRLLDE